MVLRPTGTEIIRSEDPKRDGHLRSHLVGKDPDCPKCQQEQKGGGS